MSKILKNDVLELELVFETTDAFAPPELLLCDWSNRMIQALLSHCSATMNHSGCASIMEQRGLDLQKYITESTALSPLRKLIRHRCEKEITTLGLTLVDNQTSCDLNTTYRHKNKPTNVLSFPGLYEPEKHLWQLGDIVIAPAVAQEEANAQGKALEAHWAHLLLHGLLHLLGFDHESEPDAVMMESIETQLMTELGFSDPYQSDSVYTTTASPAPPVKQNHHQRTTGSQSEAIP